MSKYRNDERHGCTALPAPRLPHAVVMLVYPEIAAIDVAGPMEAFGLANYLAGRPLYALSTASVDGLPVAVTGGYAELAPSHGFASLALPIGTLLIPGSPTAALAARDRRLLDGLARVAPQCQRVGSVCTGTYILAASGLARGRRVATHWHDTQALARLHPELEVDGEAIFVESGRVWSSAGMTTGIDLALALIERDHGRLLALAVARHLVLYLKRSGGQSQFSPQLAAQAAACPRIERVQQRIADDPAGDLSVPTLARLVAVSPRSLVRQFKAATGRTLGDHIADVRLGRARALIEEGGMSLKQVATASGLGSVANLRRVFLQRMGLSPSAYRERVGERMGV